MKIKLNNVIQKMNFKSSFVGLALLFPLYLHAQGFEQIKQPINGITTIYGSTANGCIVGAATLPSQGRGFQVMRTSRNRYYGHPNLIKFIEKMGAYANNKQRLLLIGDLGQAAGGPMPSGHASHQVGLDADIWFYNTNLREFNPTWIESLEMRTVVDKEVGSLNNDWQNQYLEDLKIAAQDNNVDRIFVNPVIKQAICRQVDVDQNSMWLRKLRPWWGHDSHFHVRLKCPNDQAFCEIQAPIPSGSGCDADLDNWVNDQILAITHPKKPSKTAPVKKKAELPMECKSILYNF